MNFQRLDADAIQLSQVTPIGSSIQQSHTTILQQSRHSINYRPDIDGLRTVAIMLVIVYHAWPRSLPGGFIGVDIFFVISGYLITQIIIKESQKGKFSFIDFYCRRVKRIFPALLIVLTFTLYIAARYSQKDQAKSTFTTLDASVLFGANLQVLFYDKGYFDPDIRLNPLLHLWSLGVEQQFYIFWPCLMLVVLNTCKNRTLLTLGIYAGFSFVLAIIGVYMDTKFAFYFPVCRFWQMAVGGILAYLNIKIHKRMISNFLSTVAIIAIFCTVLIMDDKSLFPGFWALIPTFSSAFIIQAKNEAFINKHILSSKIFVWIGKISYSLYLWHWPLLVFSKTFYPPGSTSIFANTFFIVFLTFVLTILTYFIAEDPIRKMKGKQIVYGLVIMMVILGISTLVINLKILPQLQIEKQQSTINFLNQAQKQMHPRQQDYVQLNGTKYPNLSKSQNRTPTTVEKIRTSKTDQVHDYANGRQHVLEKQIDSSSRYYIKDRPYLDYYSVANQGKQNILLLIGDSHALKLNYRFQQLYRDSANNNTLSTFPTIISMIRYGDDTTQYHTDMMQFAIRFAKEFHPKRIMLINHWLNRWCTDAILSFNEPANCNMQKLHDHNDYLFGYINQLISLGVEISINAVDIETQLLNPLNMVDFNGVIQQNIKPFRLSVFKNKYKQVIESFETSMKNANISVIDLSDNLCWMDICHVLSPSGHGVYVDGNHYGKFYSRHWLTVVDRLVQF